MDVIIRASHFESLLREVINQTPEWIEYFLTEYTSSLKMSNFALSPENSVIDEEIPTLLA